MLHFKKPTAVLLTLFATLPSLYAQEPLIHQFEADPPVISSGAGSTLSLTVSNAISVSIDQGIGTVGTTELIYVKPVSTTTYKVTAENDTHVAGDEATVTVIDDIRWIPHVTSSGGGFETRLTITNSSAQDGTLIFQAYDTAGNPFDQNAPLTVSAGGFVNLSSGELFPGLEVSHFSVLNNAACETCLVTAAYRIESSQIGGTAHVNETADIQSEFVIYPGEPEVVFDGMALVNLGDAPAEVRGILVDDRGRETFNEIINPALPPRAKQLLVFGSFFPNEPDKQVRIVSGQQAVVTFLRGSLPGASPRYLYQVEAVPARVP